MVRVRHSRGPPFPGSTIPAVAISRNRRYFVLPSSEYGSIKVLPVTLNWTLSEKFNAIPNPNPNPNTKKHHYS